MYWQTRRRDSRLRCQGNAAAPALKKLGHRQTDTQTSLFYRYRLVLCWPAVLVTEIARKGRSMFTSNKLQGTSEVNFSNFFKYFGLRPWWVWKVWKVYFASHQGLTKAKIIEKVWKVYFASSLSYSLLEVERWPAFVSNFSWWIRSKWQSQNSKSVLVSVLSRVMDSWGYSNARVATQKCVHKRRFYPYMDVLPLKNASIFVKNVSIFVKNASIFGIGKNGVDSSYAESSSKFFWLPASLRFGE